MKCEAFLNSSRISPLSIAVQTNPFLSLWAMERGRG